MSSVAALAHELDELELVQSKLADVVIRRDDRRRQDLIALRRRLVDQMNQVRQTAAPLIQERCDSDALGNFNDLFFRMRAAATMHQANWPAVTLGEREDEYRASAMKVRDANRAFLAWVRKTIPHLHGAEEAGS